MSRAETIRELVSYLRPLVLNSGRVVEAGLRDVGWTLAGRAVVETLSDMGSATVPRLGERLDLPRQAVQRQVDELLALGHVETRPNPEHRRSALVALTSAGRRAWEGVASAELTAMGRLAPQCTHADLRAAVRVLAALDTDVRALAHSQGVTP